MAGNPAVGLYHFDLGGVALAVEPPARGALRSGDFAAHAAPGFQQSDSVRWRGSRGREHDDEEEIVGGIVRRRQLDAPGARLALGRPQLADGVVELSALRVVCDVD